MRDYKYKVEDLHSRDEEPEASQERAALIAAAAGHLGEVYLWIWGKEKSRTGPRYARFVTIATIMGKMTPVQAAKEARCSPEVIYMNRRDFFERFSEGVNTQGKGGEQ